MSKPIRLIVDSVDLCRASACCRQPLSQCVRSPAGHCASRSGYGWQFRGFGRIGSQRHHSFCCHWECWFESSGLAPSSRIDVRRSDRDNLLSRYFWSYALYGK